MIVNIFNNNFGATDLEAAQAIMADLSGANHSDVDFTYISLDKLCIDDADYDGDEEDYYNNPNYEFPEGGQFVFAAYADGEIHGIWLITDGNEDFIDKCDTRIKEYCGIRINGILCLLDFEDVEELKKYSSEYTYAEWSDRDSAYTEVSAITEIKVWLFPTI